MGKWIIEKQFSFDYGHRVWSQKLDINLSLDAKLACRHLHGHRGEVFISLYSDVLKGGMVTDFKHLNWFKKFLDEVLDHKMILDMADPSIPDLYPKLIDENGLLKLDYSNKHVCEQCGYFVVREDVIKHSSDAMKEVYEGLVFVPFVPTSENLSHWLFKIVESKMGSIVDKVLLYETPKSCAEYHG